MSGNTNHCSLDTELRNSQQTVAKFPTTAFAVSYGLLTQT